MKLHLNSHEGNRITACRDNTVHVNGEIYRGNLLVLPDRLIDDWQCAGIAALTAETLAPVAAYAESGMVALLGCGDKSPPINPEWQRPFAERQAALEIMSLPAACRTYNFLCADGRLVMAALLIA